MSEHSRGKSVRAGLAARLSLRVRIGEWAFTSYIVGGQLKLIRHKIRSAAFLRSLTLKTMSTPAYHSRTNQNGQCQHFPAV